MPRNLRGGKGFKKMKKPFIVDETISRKKMILAENNEDEGIYQTYGMVSKRLGGKRVELLCHDGVKRKAVIPGKMIKKVWLNPNDVVLCSLGSLGNDNECYVEHKYNQHDINILKRDYDVYFMGSIENNEECNFVASKTTKIENDRNNVDIYAELDMMSNEYSDDEDI